jgi:hypothetical protein
MSVTQPMQLTISVISNLAILSNLGAMFYPTFSQQFSLKYVWRRRLLFRWKRDVDRPHRELHNPLAITQSYYYFHRRHDKRQYLVTKKTMDNWLQQATVKCWSAVQLMSGVSPLYMSVLFKAEWERIQFDTLSKPLIKSTEFSHSATEFVQTYE